MYQRLVSEGFPPGIALDDGVGAHYVGTDLHELVTASGTSRGYFVDVDSETPLDARVL